MKENYPWAGGKAMYGLGLYMAWVFGFLLMIVFLKPWVQEQQNQHHPGV